MKSSLFRDLSRQYEESASVLAQKRQWSASYHLAGLSVEMALKACIARKFARNEIPEKKLILQIYTHDLTKLVGLAELERDRLNAQRRSATFANFWATVTEWDSDSRYRNWSMAEAKHMLEAVTEQSDGVTAWIRSFW